MKHRVAGRKLGRTSAHRLALLRNLSTSLFRHERIRTTLMKAKELRPFAEKLITVGKRGDVTARRRVARQIHDPDVAKKLVDSLSTRFAERPGGYTRIVKLGPRRGDAAEMALIELIGSELVLEVKEAEPKPKGRLGRVRDRLTRRRASGEGGKSKKGAASASSEAPAPKKRAPAGAGKAVGKKTASRARRPSGSKSGSES